MTTAMSAHAAPAPGRPTLMIRGTPYPVLLPKLSDPRLHLAAVIISLQVLGQVGVPLPALDRADPHLARSRARVLEVGIAFRRQHVIMWPASALLTGNGVAFILRVPGHAARRLVEHARLVDLRRHRGRVAALEVRDRWRGEHVFNPSNFGLVLCFLILGRSRAEPLDFWWGPMSAWLVLALAIIVAGGLAILWRLRLLGIAVGFWLAFAAGIGVLAASGHAMSARWHLGPITGRPLLVGARDLARDPRLPLLHDHRPEDGAARPRGRGSSYAVSVGLLAALLIAPVRTEYATKVARARLARDRLRGAAARCGCCRCAMRLARRGLVLAAASRRSRSTSACLVAASAAGAARRAATGAAVSAAGLPPITIEPSRGVISQLDQPTARRIARDLVAVCPCSRASADRVRLWLEPGEGQDPPIAVARADAGMRTGKTRDDRPER